MRKTKSAFLLGLMAVALLISASPIYGNQEQILNPHILTMTANAGEPFGEVKLDLKARTDAKGCRILSIILTIGGKQFVVPEEQFRDLENPMVATTELHREPGRDPGGPWLYVTFLAPSLAQSDEGIARVYLRFRDGKIHKRSIVRPGIDYFRLR